MSYDKMIFELSAHGTNPASANVAGFEVIELETNADGSIDIEKLKAVLSDEIAGFMLTNPSTLGFFETQIEEVASLVHASGGLLYYDGASMKQIAKETKENPEIFKTAPHHSPAGRIDEALAARKPVLTYKPSL